MRRATLDIQSPEPTLKISKGESMGEKEWEQPSIEDEAIRRDLANKRSLARQGGRKGTIQRWHLRLPLMLPLLGKTLPLLRRPRIASEQGSTSLNAFALHLL